MSRADDRASRLAYRRVAAVGIFVLVVDQLTKRLAVAAVPDRGERQAFVPLLDLVHVRNDGVAFSSFAGNPVIVALLVLGALCVLLAWFLRNRTKPFAWLVTGMLAGGALGNVLDRLVEGAVIDFLQPTFWPSFPAFNVSDSCIVLGMVLLVVVVERDHRSEGDGDTTAVQRG